MDNLEGEFTAAGTGLARQTTERVPMGQSKDIDCWPRRRCNESTIARPHGFIERKPGPLNVVVRAIPPSSSPLAL
jgi:hypothetical protein